MRLRSLRLQNITRFQEPVEVDFAALGEGLIAIAGANGEGKTTILEAPFAALYGEFPTRPGSLYSVAHGRDAKIELEVEDGQPYRALVAVDAIGQKTEAYLFDEEGQPLTSGKVREYNAEVERRFGSARLMLSAALSCQTKRGSFLDLSKAERKDLLAEILDTGGLQRLSEAARARGKTGELQLERLRGQLAEAEEELVRLGARPRHEPAAGVLWDDAHPDGEIDNTENLTIERSGIEAEIKASAADLEAARQRHAELQTQHALAVEAEKQRAGKQRELSGIDQQSLSLNGKLMALPLEQIRAHDRTQAGILEAEREAERLPEYEAAATALPPARGHRTQAQDDLREWNTRLREARETLLAKTRETGKAGSVRTRLAAAQRQAGLLGEVPCTVRDYWQRVDTGPDGNVSGVTASPLAATCPLLADARGAKAAIGVLEGELSDVQVLEAALPEYQHAVDRAEVAVKDGLVALQGAEAEVQRLDPLAGAVPVAQAAVKRAAELQEQLEETLIALTAREQEYREQIEALATKRTALALDLEGMVATDAAGIKAEIDLVARQVQELRATVEELQADLQGLVRAIAQAEAEAKRRAELGQRVALNHAAAEKLAGDLGEWGMLERGFGRDGIQALEIDAAGPELSALTNELLTSCFGPRFELRFVTQAPKADGKSQKEVFDVQVIDHDRGREGAVDSLSGGEKTIASEAISLALAIYVGKHSGRHYSTLWRDETAGALDPDNANRYLQMLRKARGMAGASQLIFIAQQEELWSQADAVLWVENGHVEVRA
jgi:exonuclease SbcC